MSISYQILDELLETVAIEVVVDVHAERVGAGIHGPTTIFADGGPGCPKGHPLVIWKLCHRSQGNLAVPEQFVVGFVDLILVKLIVPFLVLVLLLEVEKVAVDSVVLVRRAISKIIAIAGLKVELIS